jgi:DUF4097 and DUF4098 domain-containing protein YvlB
MKYAIVLVLVLLPTLAFAGMAHKTKHIGLSKQGIDRLVIRCGAGFLDLNAVEDLDKIKVTAEIEVEGYKKEDIDNFIEQNVRLTLEKKKNRALLKSEIPDYPFVEVDARINLKIEIPKELDVKITDGSGFLRVQNLIGNLVIDDDTGIIQVENVVGEVAVYDGSGKIVIEDIIGNVMVRDGSGTIEMDHIQGDVYVADGSGALTILHVKGNVTVSDDSGDIDISDVSGTVFIAEMGSGEVNIERIKGKIMTRE